MNLNNTHFYNYLRNYLYNHLDNYQHRNLCMILCK